MDYKEITETLRWHIRHSEMRRAELRVFLFLLTEQDYKSGEVKISYCDLANIVKLSKQAVSKAISSLADDGAIAIKEAGGAGVSAVYKVRSSSDMKILFEREVISDERKRWDDDFYRLFGDVVAELQAIGAGCEDCAKEQGESDDDVYCPMHDHFRSECMDKSKYREMLIWQSDNPEPPFMVRAVVR